MKNFIEKYNEVQNIDDPNQRLQYYHDEMLKEFVNPEEANIKMNISQKDIKSIKELIDLLNKLRGMEGE